LVGYRLGGYPLGRIPCLGIRWVGYWVGIRGDPFSLGVRWVPCPSCKRGHAPRCNVRREATGAGMSRPRCRAAWAWRATAGAYHVGMPALTAWAWHPGESGNVGRGRPGMPALTAWASHPAWAPHARFEQLQAIESSRRPEDQSRPSARPVRYGARMTTTLTVPG